MKNSKIWLITGISSGLGKALAEKVIQKGDFVIGTFRNQTQVDDFNERFKEKAQSILLDINDIGQIEKAIEFIQKQGRIDILVNNAGFGFIGAVEEASSKEIREVMETNFFGTLALTQALLPIFRSQKSGHILQISSHGGFKAFAGFGIYNASKFALEGFSEALALELSPLGIHLTIVEPGPFRTDFAGTALKFSNKIIEDYSDTAGAFRTRMSMVNGKQEGDPQKAAEAIYALTKEANPPLRLPLGKIAVQSLSSKIAQVQQDLSKGTPIANRAVFES